MIDPTLAKRLYEGADAFVAAELYSDQVHSLLIQAADALDHLTTQSSEVEVERVARAICSPIMQEFDGQRPEYAGWDKQSEKDQDKLRNLACLAIAALSSTASSDAMKEALEELVAVITEAWPALANTPPVAKARAALSSDTQKGQP